MGDEEDLQDALRFPADAILVDSMTQSQRGGTGKLCDWRLAARLSEKCRVVLAGGISPDNIAEAASPGETGNNRREQRRGDCARNKR